MKENLKYDKDSYGSDMCYNNEIIYCNTYGRLFNWAAAMAGSASSSANPSGVQ